MLGGRRLRQCRLTRAAAQLARTSFLIYCMCAGRAERRTRTTVRAQRSPRVRVVLPANYDGLGGRARPAEAYRPRFGFQLDGTGGLLCGDGGWLPVPVPRVAQLLARLARVHGCRLVAVVARRRGEGGMPWLARGLSLAGKPRRRLGTELDPDGADRDGVGRGGEVHPEAEREGAIDGDAASVRGCANRRGAGEVGRVVGDDERARG